MRQDDYDAVSATVRNYVTERLYHLEQNLRPYVDGTLGDPQPAHLSVYTTLLRDLARLWEAHKRPPEAEERIPAAQVEAMLEAARLEAEQEQQAAVEQARLEARMELEAAQRLDVDAAREAVVARMLSLSRRATQD